MVQIKHSPNNRGLQECLSPYEFGRNFRKYPVKLALLRAALATSTTMTQEKSPVITHHDHHHTCIKLNLEIQALVSAIPSRTNKDSAFIFSSRLFHYVIPDSLRWNGFEYGYRASTATGVLPATHPDVKEVIQMVLRDLKDVMLV